MCKNFSSKFYEIFFIPFVLKVVDHALKCGLDLLFI